MNEIEFLQKLRGDRSFRTKAKNILFFYGSIKGSGILNKEISLDKKIIKQYLEYIFWDEYSKYLFKIKNLCKTVPAFKKGMRKRPTAKFADFYNNSVEQEAQASLYILEEVFIRYFKR